MADKQYVGAVTVKRRTGIVNYWAYYRDTAGKQRLRSLKTNNLKEALARAKKINDSLTSGTDERLDTVRRNRATTFASVMEAYLKVTTWSPSTLDRNLFRIKLINDRWGDVPAAQITPHDIGLYLQELVESRSIATRNRYLAVLRKVFGYAFDNALIPTNPTDGLKQLKEPERIPTALTAAQFGQIMNVLPPYAQIIMGILHDTGMRAGELHSLRWRHIRSDQRRIVIEDAKNSELRLIPMTDYVYGIFEELRQGSAFSQTQKGQSRATIHWPDGSNPEAVVIPPIDIKKSLAVAAEKVGLPKLTRHMMRHTFATFLGSKGATDMDLMDLGGWKSVAMVRRYRKVVDERLDDVMDAFNENGEEQISER